MIVREDASYQLTPAEFKAQEEGISPSQYMVVIERTAREMDTDVRERYGRVPAQWLSFVQFKPNAIAWFDTEAAGFCRVAPQIQQNAGSDWLEPRAQWLYYADFVRISQTHMILFAADGDMFYPYCIIEVREQIPERNIEELLVASSGVRIINDPNEVTMVMSNALADGVTLHDLRHENYLHEMTVDDVVQIARDVFTGEPLLRLPRHSESEPQPEPQQEPKELGPVRDMKPKGRRILR